MQSIDRAYYSTHRHRSNVVVMDTPNAKHFVIEAVTHDKKVITPETFSSKEDTMLTIHDRLQCIETNAVMQYWRLDSEYNIRPYYMNYGNTRYFLVHVGEGLPVQLKDLDGKPNKNTFKITDNMITDGEGHRLELSSAEAANGTAVISVTKNGQPAQPWRLVYR